MTEAKGRGLLLVMMEVDPAHEEEFNRWYEQEHIPERVACPGVLSARRFVAVEGDLKYLALYDLESPDVIESPAYQKLRAVSPWAKKVRETVVKMVRNVYVEIPIKPYPAPNRD